MSSTKTCPKCNTENWDYKSFCSNCDYSFIGKNKSIVEKESEIDNGVDLKETVPETKICPFCAEEIKYAAIKCKHCGEFIDKEALLSRLQNDEKKTSEIKTLLKKQNATNKGNYYYKKNISSTTNLLKVFLWVFFANNIISLILNISQRNYINSQSFSLAEMAAHVQQNVGIFQLGSFIITAIIFLRWVYIVNLNCHGFGAKGMEYSPSGSVGYYFMPFANLFMPYLSMKEIWQVSTNPSNWKKEQSDSLIAWWWAFWLISGFLGCLTLQKSLQVDTLSSYQSALSLMMISNIINIFLFTPTLSLVSSIARKQESLVYKKKPLPL